MSKEFKKQRHNKLRQEETCQDIIEKTEKLIDESRLYRLKIKDTLEKLQG